uniref:Pyridoxal 5'-phosphate synthase subunit PdxS n=1 Tax=Methanococcus maripaludis (strain C6 / ATCC BAA-1332) TaxID=444158 RepID=PDXS_METM6|nr:RecName: Full=Pyridoxal 5'-phosphate synthase subunit PdxS; Short=PLP synthase subunit PdxS; AltName: Full=Pdx1 [Methanococcus maripaludis C6]
MKKLGTDLLKRGFAKMVKHGVVMDVTNVEQAQIAEDAGAAAVMALERVPADIRVQGGVARMSDPEMILEIKDAVSIPVMAKARIGHFVEAQLLESIGVDMVDESEVLTPADEVNHIDKRAFTAPFVCGARNLGEALRRIDEGAAMIRTKGEAGTGNVVEAVKHMRAVNEGIARVVGYKEMGLEAELIQMARNELKVPMELISEVAELKRLPVVNFAAGGIATPADAALMMQMGCDGVFVGSGIFKSGNPATRAKAIVEATYNFDKPAVIGEVSKNLGEAMVGINIDEIPEEKLLAKRGI